MTNSISSSDNLPTSRGDEKPWRDKALFIKEYVEKGRTGVSLAQEWKTTPLTISNWAKKHGVAKRGPSKAKGANLHAVSSLAAQVNSSGEETAQEMMAILATWGSLPGPARKALRETLRQMIEKL